MPFFLKSAEEARAHLNEASRKVMERVNSIKGALPKGPESEPISKLATLVGEAWTTSTLSNTRHGML